jgi:serine/threonine protein kinase
MYLHESTIIKQLVSAVSYLHNLQVPVIHKDIKPTNILVNNLGKVKLIDFGLSSKKTDIKNIKIGTRFYIAPECSGDYICEKVDIYSLGVVFYCIINRTIYEGETMVITCPDMKCLIKQMLDSDPRKRLHINDVKEKLKLIYYNL